MKVKAFGFNLDADQHLVVKLVSQILCDEVEVIDLKSFNPEIDKTEIALVYGDRAYNLMEGKESLQTMKLPDPFRLDPAFNEDISELQQVKAKLLKLKETLNLSNPIDNTTEIKHDTEKTLDLDKELPTQLTATNVEKLERQQLDQGISHWSGWTVDGRSIRVTVEPEKDTADINLTFAELNAVMGLKEAFRVKELTFVYKPTNATGKGSNK